MVISVTEGISKSASDILFYLRVCLSSRTMWNKTTTNGFVYLIDEQKHTYLIKLNYIVQPISVDLLSFVPGLSSKKAHPVEI